MAPGHRHVSLAYTKNIAVVEPHFPQIKQCEPRLYLIHHTPFDSIATLPFASTFGQVPMPFCP